ncbi:MAG: hypothetical protein ACE5JQ_05465 [Candidatus Methylomirabilales bacterium]
MIKLVIKNMGFPSVLVGNPVALLRVAAGAIGVIKALEHLRSVCYLSPVGPGGDGAERHGVSASGPPSRHHAPMSTLVR